jgi:hypothetical protein
METIFTGKDDAAWLPDGGDDLHAARAHFVGLIGLTGDGFTVGSRRAQVDVV